MLRSVRATGGEPLSPSVRAFMEPRFGKDFSNVRVHRDSSADLLARAVEAKAFTIGRDVFFRRGAFEPDSDKGKHLLAHELTHVVQQGQGMRGVQREVLQREEAQPNQQSSTERNAEATEHPIGSKWLIRTTTGNVCLRVRAREDAAGIGNLTSGTVVTVIAASDPATERDARAKGFVAVRGKVEGGRTAAGFVHVRYLVAEAQPAPPETGPEPERFYEIDARQEVGGETLLFGTLKSSVQESPDYIDNRVEAVGVGLMLGGYRPREDHLQHSEGQRSTQ